MSHVLELASGLENGILGPFLPDVVLDPVVEVQRECECGVGVDDS